MYMITNVSFSPLNYFLLFLSTSSKLTTLFLFLIFNVPKLHQESRTTTVRVSFITIQLIKGLYYPILKREHIYFSFHNYYFFLCISIFHFHLFKSLVWFFFQVCLRDRRRDRNEPVTSKEICRNESRHHRPQGSSWIGLIFLGLSWICC